MLLLLLHAIAVIIVVIIVVDVNRALSMACRFTLDVLSSIPWDILTLAIQALPSSLAVLRMLKV